MKIQVLGPGCAKCSELEANVKKTIDALEIDADIEKITDMVKIMKMGVLSTPGLVVDGVVKSVGKVPSISELKEILG